MSEYVALAQDMVRRCATPAEGLSIKAQIRQASRTLGWPFNRTKKVWYGECVVRVDEWESLKARIEEAEQRAIARRELAYEIRARLDSAGGSRGSGIDGRMVSETR